MLQLAHESVNRAVLANGHEATSPRSPRVYKGCQRRPPELVYLWDSHVESGPGTGGSNEGTGDMRELVILAILAALTYAYFIYIKPVTGRKAATMLAGLVFTLLLLVVVCRRVV